MRDLASAQLADFLVDLLAPVGVVRTQRFFSGIALTVHGVQFAFLMKGSFYLRVDDEGRKVLEAQGSDPFSYGKRTGRVVMTSYYAAPAHLVDDGEALCGWAQRAILCACAARTRRKRKRKRSLAL
jgi:DNA transformation protein and related proteins